jgi:hypothetical protein
MAYADFDLKTAVRTFGLTTDRDADVFAAAEPLEPSRYLRDWLEEFAPLALGINTERARSGFLIAPVLVEMRRRTGRLVNILPGVPFDVDTERGLAGCCDYLIARSPAIYYVQAPILAVVEAKKEDLIAGLGQCVAEMVAIRIFNEREGTPIAPVFGCVTSGSIWRFLKLEEPTLYIGKSEYYLPQVAKILGILVSIARG